MRPTVRPVAFALAVFAGVHLVSLPADAQEAPPAEPGEPAAHPAAEPAAEPALRAAPAGPASDVPTDAEDAEARKVLEAAADRQGGTSLAPPEGKLESFHVVFHKVTVHRRVERDGSVTVQKMDSETPGLVLDWKDGLIRTEWRLSGDRPTVRGIERQRTRDGELRDRPWIFDGTEPRRLSREQHPKDVEELDRDRSIVKALLQVAILRSMLHDGSRWKLVEDAAHPGAALRRTPPAAAETPLRLTLWVDPATKDVSAARLSPNEPDESTMTYLLRYDPKERLPAVAGAQVRFPLYFDVFEQRDAAQEPRPVMNGTIAEVGFNGVADDVFAMPRGR